MQNRSNSCNNNSNGKKQKPQIFFVWGGSRAPLKTKTVVCADPAGWRIFASIWIAFAKTCYDCLQCSHQAQCLLPFFYSGSKRQKTFCYANEQGDHIKRCSYNSEEREEKTKTKKKLTWGVAFVVVGHLEGMSVVENLTAVAGVVLQGERLQSPVERCFCDVNGRLAGSVGDTEFTSPCTWSFKMIWRKMN